MFVHQLSASNMSYPSFLILSHDFCLQLRKASKRLLRDKPSGSDDEDNRMITYNANENSIDTVGDANPVQDFEAMISRRDGNDWTDKAISEMKKRIVKLVEDSTTDEVDKALECLLSLRKCCVLEQVSSPLPVSFILTYVLKTPCHGFVLTYVFRSQSSSMSS